MVFYFHPNPGPSKGVPVLPLLLSLVLSSFLPSLSHAAAAVDRAGIEAWLRTDIPRGRNYPVKNALPQGTRIKFCAGAGCKIKVPYSFTEAQLRDAEHAMETARRERSCSADNAACERLALQYGVRSLDQAVKRAKLTGMSLSEITRESINRDNDNNPAFFGDKLSPGQQLLRDCVDQAANGTSYLILLAERGLVKHHRVIAPGMINLGLQPHFFSRLEENGGRKFRFDLYRTPRTDFEKLPGVVAQ